jgi:hypothetical protein
VILVRYVWLNLSPKSARMEQSYSPDGGQELGSELDLRVVAVADEASELPVSAAEERVDSLILDG